MKKIFKSCFIFSIIAFCGFLLSAYISSEDGKSKEFSEAEAEINDCILCGEEAFAQGSIIPVSLDVENSKKFQEETIAKDGISLENNKILLNDEAIENLSMKRENEFSRYFTANLAESYTNHTKYWLSTYSVNESSPVQDMPFYASIGSGILDFHLGDLLIEGDSAVASADFVNWLMSIEETKPGQEFTLILTISSFHNEYSLLRSDGLWQIDQMLECRQEGAPLGYNPLKGTYSSLAEALSAAEKWVPEEENLF